MDTPSSKDKKPGESREIIFDDLYRPNPEDARDDPLGALKAMASAPRIPLFKVKMMWFEPCDQSQKGLEEAYIIQRRCEAAGELDAEFFRTHQLIKRNLGRPKPIGVETWEFKSDRLCIKPTPKGRGRPLKGTQYDLANKLTRLLLKAELQAMKIHGTVPRARRNQKSLTLDKRRNEVAELIAKGVAPHRIARVLIDASHKENLHIERTIRRDVAMILKEMPRPLKQRRPRARTEATATNRAKPDHSTR